MEHCYATIPKKEFPYLMTRLLVEKKYWEEPHDWEDPHDNRPIDQTKYREAIISGFRKTGLHPVDMQQPLSQLPNLEIDMDVATPIQIQLLNKLDQLRHNPPANKHPGRPKKDQQFPAGESHTFNPGQGSDVVEVMELDVDVMELSSSSDKNSSSSSSSSSSEEDTRPSGKKKAPVSKRAPPAKKVYTSAGLAAIVAAARKTLAGTGLPTKPLPSRPLPNCRSPPKLAPARRFFSDSDLTDMDTDDENEPLSSLVKKKALSAQKANSSAAAGKEGPTTEAILVDSESDQDRGEDSDIGVEAVQMQFYPDPASSCNESGSEWERSQAVPAKMGPPTKKRPSAIKDTALIAKMGLNAKKGPPARKNLAAKMGMGPPAKGPPANGHPAKMGPPPKGPAAKAPPAKGPPAEIGPPAKGPPAEIGPPAKGPPAEMGPAARGLPAKMGPPPKSSFVPTRRILLPVPGGGAKLLYGSGFKVTDEIFKIDGNGQESDVSKEESGNLSKDDEGAAKVDSGEERGQESDGSDEESVKLSKDYEGAAKVDSSEETGQESDVSDDESGKEGKFLKVPVIGKHVKYVGTVPVRCRPIFFVGMVPYGTHVTLPTGTVPMCLIWPYLPTYTYIDVSNLAVHRMMCLNWPYIR